jgi:hypothetical protein
MNQLDRIEQKLDAALERIAVSETDLRWIKGSIKVGVPVLASVIGYLFLQGL